MEKTNFSSQKGSVTSPAGFVANGIACGIKDGKPDLVMVKSQRRAAAAALFTTNQFKAAPVLVSQEHMADPYATAIVINSGNANSCTGGQGLADAREMARLAAQAAGCDPQDVLVASTGVIGHFLPMSKLAAGMARIGHQLSDQGGPDAAQAIMTTDTVPKHRSIGCELNGTPCVIGAMAKGSGMIQPNLATMIAVVTTDADIAPAMLDKAMRSSLSKSFNLLTIDGEMSTNDCLFALANGMAGNPRITAADAGFERFQQALDTLLIDLTKDMARDGEGATRLLTVTVDQARSKKEAEQAARRIANSMLVKTAVFGQDPNWGRVLSALGATDVHLDIPAVQIIFAGIAVFKDGTAQQAAREALKQAMENKEIDITVRLGAGTESATCFSCDLTYDYIKINAEYHT